MLFDGRGGEYDATLIRVAGDHAEVELGEHRSVERESPLHCHLGLALTRGRRLDYAVQKATELGVVVLTLLITEHCAVRWSSSQTEARLRHLRAVVVHGCEQSGRNRLPELHAPLPLRDWLRTVDCPLRLLLSPEARRSRWPEAAPDSVALLCGPEGGLSDEEQQLATGEYGFTAMSLGPRVLRSETAPLAALAIVQHLWGDGCRD